MVSRAAAAAAARGKVDEHVFLRKHRKSANRFREGDLFCLEKNRRVCRTYAVRGKRPITQGKSARWSILRVAGYALSRFVLVRCCRVNPTHLAPSLFARQVIIGFRVQGEFAALPIVGEIWRAMNLKYPFGIWIFPTMDTKYSEHTIKRGKEIEERINRP